MATPVSAENEKIIREAVIDGHFENSKQALDEAIELLRERIEDDQSNGRILPPDEWIIEFTAWARSHRPRDSKLDDSRESIYEGRGE